MEVLEKYKVMIDENTLQTRIKELAQQINKDYAGKNIIVIGVLKGAFIFLADLIRNLTVDVDVRFMSASSYGNALETTGKVKVAPNIGREICGENVIIVEDIIDSGFTMNEVMNILKEQNPESLKLCACLSKPSRRQTDVKIDYLGFEIPDKFVLGYGLDYCEYYRNLPYIAVVE